MSSSNLAYALSTGNNGGSYNNSQPTAQAPNPQGIESRLAQSEPMLTIGDVAGILRVGLPFIKRGLDGLPEQLKDVRGDGSYFACRYYLNDVVSFLEKARGQPLPDGPLEPLLTPKEVAEMLHVHPTTIKYRRNKGFLPAYNLGPYTIRYDRRDVEPFAERLTTNQVAEMLGVGPGTIGYWRNEGILPAYRLGHAFRYYRRDVEPFAGTLTTNEVAEMLHVSLSTVKRLRNKGILHPYKLGPKLWKYNKKDVEAIAGKLTTKDVAEMLHVNPQTIYDWGSKGILPRVRLGKKTFRYDPREVKAFAEKLGINID